MFGEKELPESERVYRSFRRYIALAHLLIPIWFFLAIASYAAAWGPGVGTPLINRSMFILLFVPLAVLIWYFYRTGRERASVGPKLGIPIALIAIVSPFAGLTYFGGDITEYFEFALGFSFSSIVLSWMIVLTPRDYSQEERQEGESGDSDGNREREKREGEGKDTREIREVEETGELEEGEEKNKITGSGQQEVPSLSVIVVGGFSMIGVTLVLTFLFIVIIDVTGIPRSPMWVLMYFVVGLLGCVSYVFVTRDVSGWARIQVIFVAVGLLIVVIMVDNPRIVITILAGLYVLIGYDWFFSSRSRDA